jgi:nitrilase
MHLAAAIQMTSTADKEANLRKALALIEEAAGRGASFVALPECFLYMGPEREKAQYHRI